MACLLQAPDASAKGTVTFTTPERDNLILKAPQLRAAVEQLKQRFWIGLHHNWHDFEFAHNPLFDFSMAGDGDLIEINGKDFQRVGIDACNFVPSFFTPGDEQAKFWDVLNVGRAVDFKGIAESLRAIRMLYDKGNTVRVLYICALPPVKTATDLRDIRRDYESLFNIDERQRFSFVTIDWDYPFPFDLETLAHFYRSSRTFLHPAPVERRCRTAAYAWHCQIPVVGGENVSSILPPEARREPFFYRATSPEEMAAAIERRLKASNASDDDWARVRMEFSVEQSNRRLAEFISGLCSQEDAATHSRPVSCTNLDIRLGRHHGLASGKNKVPQDLLGFVQSLTLSDDQAIAKLLMQEDPERSLAEQSLSQPQQQSAEPRMQSTAFWEKSSWLHKLRIR